MILLGAGGASAQQSEPTHTQCAVQHEPFLLKRLGVWQQRLHLQDWKISIVFSDPSDLKPDTLGNIRWDARINSAVIRVLKPEHYSKPCAEMIADMEFTVVHELIHLELASLPKSEASRSVEERAVNRIAEALLKLDREQ